jgi:hypothetical protein
MYFSMFRSRAALSAAVSGADDMGAPPPFSSLAR